MPEATSRPRVPDTTPDPGPDHDSAPPGWPAASATADLVRHRSGAVARMLRMPVATLRMWERRHGVTQARTSASGQRLYAAADVQRLALLRQLVDLGHAIGSLARLDMAALQAVAATHAQALLVSQDRGAVAHAPAAAPAVPAPARRWHDEALADFASLSSTVACECPRHVADILLRLTQFEDYCAQCRNSSPADAQLHAYLGEVTAAARAQFEQAIERLAAHEGLLRPQPGGPRG